MKKSFALFIIFCTVFFCNPAMAGEFKVYSANAYKEITKLKGPSSISIYGDAVMLLVDFSGSMGRWLTETREVLEIILPRIPYKSAVALRVFGERQTGNGERGNACEATRLVAPFKKENQAKISEGLTSANLGGMTPLVFGLKQAVEADLQKVKVFDRYTTRKKKKIILVTDGGENCGGDPCAYINEVMLRRKDIQIDVIQLGNSDKLACLADATGGTFHKVNGSRQMFETAFETSFNLPKGTVSDSRTYNEKIIKPKRTKKCSNKQPLASNYKFVNY